MLNSGTPYRKHPAPRHKRTAPQPPCHKSSIAPKVELHKIDSSGNNASQDVADLCIRHVPQQEPQNSTLGYLVNFFCKL